MIRIETLTQTRTIVTDKIRDTGRSHSTDRSHGHRLNTDTERSRHISEQRHR